MAIWHETINIAGLHRMYSTGGIGLQQLAKGVARKLQLTEAYAICDPELMDVIFALNQIDEFARLKDYNTVLEMLYEWGDKPHGKTEQRLWVEAQGVSPNEYDDVPTKTKNPFEEDTKRQINKPHYHGPLTILKGPYHNQAQSGDEWVKQRYIEPAGPKKEENIEQWDNTKYYKIGDLVRYKNMKFECLISNANVDPDKNSKFTPGEPWKWLSSMTSKPFDPALAYKDRLTCAIPEKAKIYPTGRKHRYMSEDEFNKKLKDHNIDPPTIPKDLYSYWKDSEDKYQEWLIKRWHNQNLTFRAPNVIN